MTRQAFVRILLSLLLLITQQMAASHAMSHWGARATVHLADDGSDLSRAFALDQGCDHCLAFAQLAGPLVSSARFFAPPAMVARASAGAASLPAGARTVCAFRSRAPPQA